MSQEAWFNSSAMLKLSDFPWLFCVALSQSVHWHAPFLYCCSLYIFFPLGLSQWRSHTDWILILNMNIRLPLFWGTWSQALTRPHVRAWGIGVIIVIVEPLRKCQKSAWSMNCRKYFRTRAYCEVLKPQTEAMQQITVLYFFA